MDIERRAERSNLAAFMRWPQAEHGLRVADVWLNYAEHVAQAPRRRSWTVAA